MSIQETDAWKKFEAERVRNRPTDRALDAMARPFADCRPYAPCEAHLADGMKPVPFLGPQTVDHPS